VTSNRPVSSSVGTLFMAPDRVQLTAAAASANRRMSIGASPRTRSKN
jgi:hypothetical protein